MAKKLYEEEEIRAIANALRGKCGTTCGYKVCDMAAAIETIQGGNGGEYNILVSENNDGTQSFAISDAVGGETTKLVTKTITTNGTYVAKDEAADGYLSVTVEVPTEAADPVIESISISKNGTYTAPEGVDGYSPITVNIVPKTTTLSVTENGTYTPPTNVDGYNSVVVDVPSKDPVLNTLSITENGTYTPPAGTDGYNKVTVNVPTGGAEPTGTVTIERNGTHNVSNYAKAVVNVQPLLQNKTVTTNGTYTADEGYDALGTVTVDISSTAPFNPPAIGFVPTAYNEDGVMVKGIWYGDKVAENVFYFNEAITNVVFNDTVTEIKGSAFYGTSSLAMAQLPDTITKIGTSAFKSSNISLTKLPDSLTELGGYAFDECVNISIQSIPSGVTEIKYYGFSKCSSITNMTLHANITDVGTRAFYDCTSLTTVTFKGTPSFLSSSVFEGCTNLTTINVPWSEGEIKYAPWGATNATIVYNSTT